MSGQRLALVALLGALPLAGCGGKAVTLAPRPAETQDAATDAPSDADQHAPDAGSDTSPLDAAADVQAHASPDVVDASQDALSEVAEESDAAAEAGADSGADGDAGWDHTCWCKNWTDDRYPQDFFGGGSCVDGFITCPSVAVCCAITCVSPAVCVNTVDGWNNTMPPPAPQPPPNDCEHYDRMPTCVLPEDCAPEGVLTRRDYDPAKDLFPMCTFPGYTPAP